MTAGRLLAALATGSICPPRTALVAAHPDDETVGAGSRLHGLAAGGRLLYVTDGAPERGTDAARCGLTRAGYAAARRAELERTLGLCGIAPAQVQHLGCADQQAAFDLARLARSLAGQLRRHRIEAVLTHPYEGGHPDHDATAFAVHAAAALLQREGGCAPAIVEMTSYHLGPQGIRTGEFLHAPGIEPVTVRLSGPEQARKRELLACFESQRETLAWFTPTHERFRPAPRYDFRQPPHAGLLFYEKFPWGMDGARFTRLCARALDDLRLQGDAL